HRLDVIARESPVPLGIQVAKPQFIGKPQLDTCHAVSDFPGDKFNAAPGTFVVEEDAAGSVEAVAFTIVHGDPVAVDLGDSIRAAWVERGGFPLWHFLDFP